MLDTDYASSVLSLDEALVSDDTKERRWKVEAGIGANWSEGKNGRQKEYVLTSNSRRVGYCALT
jgi:hypothetical protein